MCVYAHICMCVREVCEDAELICHGHNELLLKGGLLFTDPEVTGISSGVAGRWLVVAASSRKA